MRATTTLSSLALLGAFALGLACGSLTEALAEEECLSSSDCGGKLSCVRPIPTGTAGSQPVNAIGLGWCLEQDTCIPGEQPFCMCGVDPTGSPICMTPSSSNRMVSATVVCQNPDALNDCWCVPQGSCPFPDP